MKRRKFNIELLSNKIKEDNATLIGDYSGKLTRNRYYFIHLLLW